VPNILQNLSLCTSPHQYNFTFCLRRKNTTLAFLNILPLTINYKYMLRIKRILRYFLAAILLCIAFIFIADRLVARAAAGRLYNRVANVPENHVGLLL